MVFYKRLLIITIISGILSLDVAASTSTTSLNINIEIQAACTLDSLDSVSANHATGSVGGQSQSGQVRVTCNAGQGFTIAMGAGLNASSFQRRVHDGMNHISYNLLKQSNGNVWGTAGTAADSSMDGAGATVNDLDSTGTGAQQVFGYEVSYTLTGTEPAGTYTDTVLVTIEF
ncbi:hypothetical protein TI05_01205 [Achromatium sp. WMS3]|nr:hypothetical protein TI05_01205 [Achromatium sp. WMS3]